jgi:hypothetical protein
MSITTITRRERDAYDRGYQEAHEGSAAAVIIAAALSAMTGAGSIILLHFCCGVL